MAIFGGIGKRLGLGSAENLVTRVTGSPIAGAIACLLYTSPSPRDS